MNIPMQPGIESKERITLLCALVGKFSPNTVDALIRYFTGGATLDLCCCIYDIKLPNLTRSINRLNEINGIVEQIKQIDLNHLSDKYSKTIEVNLSAVPGNSQEYWNKQAALIKRPQ
ncbi:hypothetical protein ACFO4O_04215 [Glaciecola siphonariae]|uniref:Uncharacterized protein n=1 Tax=Glaciecola siphonariae TaxID=521012 RepID=A0ABV9LS84_9ALTE